MTVNGKEFTWKEALNYIVVGVLGWIVLTIIEHDSRITQLEERIRIIDDRGTKYVQNNVMERLTEIGQDVKHIKELQASHNQK